MEQVALICSNPGKKLGEPCLDAARLCSDTLKAFGLWLLSAKIFLQALDWSSFSPKILLLVCGIWVTACREVSLAQDRLLWRAGCWAQTFHFPQAISHLYSRTVFLQDGTMQWGVVPCASCCNLHLDFSLLNQFLPPNLWTTTAETHQFQDSEQLRPLHFQFSLCWMGRQVGCRGKGFDLWLWLTCRTRGARTGLLNPGPPREDYANSSTIIP